LRIIVFRKEVDRVAELTSPIAGKVFKIHVVVGDTLETDDEVMVLEAMKMETPIFAPENGTVKEIKVKVGDNVNEEQLLLVIE
jgi:acetyl-CoA carboxylase biotin carboxyl carrier protein